MMMKVFRPPRIGPLNLPTRMLGGRGWLIIGWHWPWSLTWRWGLYATPPTNVKRGFYTARQWGAPWYSHMGLNTPLGNVWFVMQSNTQRDEGEGVTR